MFWTFHSQVKEHSTVQCTLVHNAWGNQGVIGEGYCKWPSWIIDSFVDTHKSSLTQKAVWLTGSFGVSVWFMQVGSLSRSTKHLKTLQNYVRDICVFWKNQNPLTIVNVQQVKFCIWLRCTKDSRWHQHDGCCRVITVWCIWCPRECQEVKGQEWAMIFWWQAWGFVDFRKFLSFEQELRWTLAGELRITNLGHDGVQHKTC